MDQIYITLFSQLLLQLQLLFFQLLPKGLKVVTFTPQSHAGSGKIQYFSAATAALAPTDRSLYDILFNNNIVTSSQDKVTWERFIVALLARKNSEKAGFYSKHFTLSTPWAIEQSNTLDHGDTALWKLPSYTLTLSNNMLAWTIEQAILNTKN